jgi:deoxyhypusine monooxygenase
MSLNTLEDCLLNKSGDVPLHNRFRALFTLKALKSEEAIDIISRGLSAIHQESPHDNTQLEGRIQRSLCAAQA